MKALITISLILFLNIPDYGGSAARAGKLFAGRREDAIDRFWGWFVKNENRLRKFETDPDRYLNELFTEIKKVKAGLAIEFDPPLDGVIRMTVSANGNPELFELVKEMVSRAPVVEGWKFVAFRQRMPLEQVRDIRLKVGELELNPSLMRFLPVVGGRELNVIIYSAGVNQDNYKQIAYACFILLDNILGEYDCTLKVSSFDFHALPDKKEEQVSLRPLLELADYVDRFYSDRRVDGGP